jgi:uncharacterized protein
MKVFGVWASAVLFAVVVGPALAQPGETPSVVVTGSAEVRAAPDKATLNVASDVKSETVAEGEALVQRQVKALLQRLTALKIPDDQINSAQVSIRPEIRWNEEARRNEPDGYRVRRDIRIELTDLSLLGPVLKAVTASDITEISPPQLGLQDPGAVDRKALGLAAKDARMQAGALAEALGLKLGAVMSVQASGDTYQPPMPMPMMRMVAADAEGSNSQQGLLTGELTVTQQATVRFQLLP